MPTIFPAKPYDSSLKSMGSSGVALHMLLRQYNFPVDRYSDKDEMIMADDDRCLQADLDHAQACYQKHTGTGEGGFTNWLCRASDEQALDFIKEILKVPASHRWTGYRIKYSVHRGNGWGIHTLELFAKDPSSDTKVSTQNPHGRGQ